MLDIVQQGFTIIFDDNDSVQVKKESDVSSLPDIDNFLPLATQRNLDFIPRNHITPIAPPPTEHTEKLKGYDLTKWFQFAHVQVYLASEREGAHMELVSELSKDSKEQKAKQAKKQAERDRYYAVKLAIR
ncbi:unnamed protein product [Umbelopsis vinacea]